MRLLSITGALCTVALLAGMEAQATTTDASYITGDKYMKMSDDARTAYVEGLSDMLSRMTGAVDNSGEKTFLDRIDRCISGLGGSIPLRNFIDKYMSEDPAYGQYGMASNFRAAMNAKCPQ